MNSPTEIATKVKDFNALSVIDITLGWRIMILECLQKEPYRRRVFVMLKILNESSGAEFKSLIFLQYILSFLETQMLS